MTETIVSVVLQKLSNVVIQESLFLFGVNDQVEFVKRELGRIQCFLKDADSKQKGDNRVQNWVKEVRDVSYWIEDVIETFLADVWRLNQEEDGQRSKIRRLHKKPMKMFCLSLETYKFGKDINKIKERVREISTSRETYGIKDLVSSSEPVNPLTRRQLVVPCIEQDIVGFEVEKKEITEILLNQNIQKRRVVSVVGQGGLGKTTLTQKIYNSAVVKNHFDFRMWLTISQDFDPIKLCKDALRALRKIEDDEIDRDEAYFIGEIRESLSNRKYFVVLDDVWQDYLWSDLFELAFLDVNNGSRVLITTRSSKIAKMADPRYVYELRFLNNEESQKLLLGKAIPEEDAIECHHLDPELVKKFVKLSGGLPLVLVVLGGLLSMKSRNYAAWCNLLESMDWQGEGNKCTEIIATSYEDLPLPLKSCFIYLASFPEDYEVQAELLIWLWVAEGLIPQRVGKIMEDTAKYYLEDLDQRCMIQVSQRSIIDGTARSFRVHDILRELAIHEADENNLLKIFSKQDDFQSNNIACRATFLFGDSSWRKSFFDDNKMIEYTNPNVRTLFYFGNIVPFHCQFKLLRVLFVQNYSNHGNNLGWWNSLKDLLHLRCLVFKKCYFDDKIVLSIHHLHNLQILETSKCHGIEVSMSLWGIKTLRHVIGVSFVGEQGSAPLDLPYLQTIRGVEILPGFELLTIPRLREFSLILTYAFRETTVTLLSKLYSLVTLIVSSKDCDIPLEIIDTRKFPSYLHLQNLSLYGSWQLKGRALNVHMFPQHLIMLTIAGSKLAQDPMPVLEKLPNLKLLKINAAYIGKRMTCSKRGFPQLQHLQLSWLEELEEWKVEEGGMPMLAHLKIWYCLKLQMVPDLHHLPTINVLELIDMEREFDLRAQNEDRWKINHIPNITIRRSWETA